MNYIFLICSGVLIALLHTFLFLQVKNLILRLLPTLISLILTTFFFIMMSLSKGWDVLGYFVLGMYTAFFILVCGVCWAVFGVIKLIKRKKKSADL